MTIRILIIDDQPDSVQALSDEIDQKMPGAEKVIVDFKQAEATIESFEPDIIVLDLLRGAGEDAPGLDTWAFVWDKKFCPLIFYTAFPEKLDEDERINHPFVRREKKGGGSEERVVGHIQTLDPHISAVAAVRTEIRRVLNRMIQEVAGRVFLHVADGNDRRDMLVRMARRRVAAAMDEQLSTGGPRLRSWEHYLYPPAITGHLLTGDLIRNRNGQTTDPSQYALVLTPSCDLVKEGERNPKVEKALVARCTEVTRLLDDAGANTTTAKPRIRQRILPLLRQGHGGSCLPLPSLPGAFPTMTADFRKLELIKLTEIGTTDQPYVRVASVDNPFRELVAWAYATIAARPGLPDRDFEAWADEIVAALPTPGNAG